MTPRAVVRWLARAITHAVLPGRSGWCGAGVRCRSCCCRTIPTPCWIPRSSGPPRDATSDSWPSPRCSRRVRAGVERRRRDSGLPPPRPGRRRVAERRNVRGRRPRAGGGRRHLHLSRRHQPFERTARAAADRRRANGARRRTEGIPGPAGRRRFELRSEDGVPIARDGAVRTTVLDAAAARTATNRLRSGP